MASRRLRTPTAMHASMAPASCVARRRRPASRAKRSSTASIELALSKRATRASLASPRQTSASAMVGMVGAEPPGVGRREGPHGYAPRLARRRSARGRRASGRPLSSDSASDLGRHGAKPLIVLGEKLLYAQAEHPFAIPDDRRPDPRARRDTGTGTGDRPRSRHRHGATRARRRSARVGGARSKPAGDRTSARRPANQGPRSSSKATRPAHSTVRLRVVLRSCRATR